MKCIHTGQPPCSRCERSKLEGCALTRPRVDLIKANRIRARRREERRAAAASAAAASSTPGTHTSDQLDDEEGEDDPEDCREEGDGDGDGDGDNHVAAAGKRHSRPKVVTPSVPGRPPAESEGRRQPLDLLAIDRHIATLPNSAILKSLNAFCNKFPELAIIHLPTFTSEFASPSCSRESMALLGAVLAVTRVQLSRHGATWAESLLSREQYAWYTKQRLADFILQPPKIQVVQTLLIITLHEWGSREFHKAWVYCGELLFVLASKHSMYLNHPVNPRR